MLWNFNNTQNGRTFSWSEETIPNRVISYAKSPANYKFMRKKMTSPPHPTTLYRYMGGSIAAMVNCNGRRLLMEAKKLEKIPNMASCL